MKKPLTIEDLARRAESRKKACKKYAKSEKGKAYYQKWCKENDKKYRISEDYKERHRKRQTEYRKSDVGKEYMKNYLREYQKNRKSLDIQFKLASLIRTRLYHAMEGKAKCGSAVRDMGCSLAELKDYLQKKFKDGMNWDNYGKWHIDHKKPLSKFDLTDREQFLQAVHYSNLQPLWAIENILKSNKI